MKLLMMVLFCWGMVLCIGGCATQRHGRMTELTNLESEDLTCRQIEIEIEKCNAFVRGVSTKDKEFTGRDILSFLGDFGIGDSWEVKDAIASATKRISQLEQLRKRKCRYDSPDAEARQELNKSIQELKEKTAVASDESDSGFTLTKCFNCERVIGKFKKSYSFEGQLVCADCYAKLKDYKLLRGN